MVIILVIEIVGHVCPGQDDHYKMMIIKTEYVLFFMMSHTEYHLIDVYIYHINRMS